MKLLFRTCLHWGKGPQVDEVDAKIPVVILTKILAKIPIVILSNILSKIAVVILAEILAKIVLP